MKVTDYVASFLAGQGVTHVFGLTGGAVVHFFDSIERQPGIEAVFMHHEQAAAFAAQAYARIARNLGVCFVTTGPGGTNAITGLAAAWLDSIPCIFISGQARLAHTTRGRKIRQLGTQQLDIVTLVRPLTKYAVMIEDLSQVRFELEKAAHIARSGRPGPVWVDVPLDFQWPSIEPAKLEGFVPESGDASQVTATESEIDRCFDLLRKAQRPLMLVGHGVQLARAEKELQMFVERTGIPVVCSWNASDMVPATCERNLGRPGMFGQRGANLAVQNCDLLLAVGSHLCVPITGTMFPAFAREANVVLVDIDPIELAEPNVHVELPIRADAGAFLRQVLSRDLERVGSREWRKACAAYRGTYNAAPNRESSDSPIDAYVFLDDLSDALREGDTVVVDGGGTINQISFQTFRGKAGQRLMISAGLCSMGSGLPESVGACFAAGRGRTICLCGDGSLQLNIQELQTILQHRLPVKIFILNNDGYLSIRQTQQQFLSSRFEGSAPAGGLTLPDATRIAAAYGIHASRVTSYPELDATLGQVLASDGPELCEIVVSPMQDVAPRQGFRQKPDGTFAARPLEDMAPMLDQDELARVMFVRPWQD